MAVGDYLLSTSVVTSGNNLQKISVLARCMNHNMVSNVSFLTVQKEALHFIPLIRDFQKEIKMKNIERPKGQMSPLILNGVKYCIISFLLIDFERIRYFKIRPLV